MPSLSDLKRTWLLRMLGLTSSNLSEADLTNQLYSSTYATGYVPPSPVGEYFYFNNSQSNIAYSTWTNSSLYFLPFLVRNQLTVDKVGLEVPTAGNAGATVRLGIYNNNSDNKPSSLLVEFGSVDAATTGSKELTINQSLAPGYYWMGTAIQNAATTLPTLRVPSEYIPVLPITTVELPGTTHIGAYGAYVQAGVSGALPSNTGALTIKNTCPKIYFRRSA